MERDAVPRPSRAPLLHVLGVGAWIAFTACASASPIADSLPLVPADTSEADSLIPTPRPESHEVLPAVTEPFRPGESLKFSVQCGIIKTDTAYLEVPQLSDWHGRNVYRLMARPESKPFTNLI